MLHDVVLQIHDRSLTSYEKKCVTVIQHPHFLRKEQFTASLVVVSCITAVSPGVLPVSIGVYRFLAKQFRDILMGLLLVSAKVDELIMR